MGNKLGRLCDSVIFQPPDRTYVKSSMLRYVRNANGETIPLAFIGNNSDFTIIFSHANAEDMGLCIDYLKKVSELIDCNVIAYDYSGYGLATGEPSEANAFADIEAVYNYARTVLDISWDKIILWGRSIGTGPTVHLAACVRVRGIILQCPMASVYRIMFKLRFTLMGDRMCNIDKIRKVQAPCYIVHGALDEICPVEHGIELWKRLKRPYPAFWARNGNHNQLDLLDQTEYFERLVEFIDWLCYETPDPVDGNLFEILPDQAQQADKDIIGPNMPGGVETPFAGFPEIDSEAP